MNTHISPPTFSGISEYVLASCDSFWPSPTSAASALLSIVSLRLRSPFLSNMSPASQEYSHLAFGSTLFSFSTTCCSISGSCHFTLLLGLPILISTFCHNCHSGVQHFFQPIITASNLYRLLQISSFE